MTRLFTRAATAALTALTLALAACSSPTSTTSASPSAGTPSASASVDVKTLTVTPGKLTIATGQPAYSPWVENDEPESGEGFEAAVAYWIGRTGGDFSKC